MKFWSIIVEIELLHSNRNECSIPAYARLKINIKAYFRAKMLISQDDRAHNTFTWILKICKMKKCLL